MKKSTAFWAGIVGALMITIVTALIRAGGIPLNMEMMLGTMITGAPSGGTWVLGLGIHLIMGGIFGLVYGAVFERATHRAGIGTGIGIGAVHAVIAGLTLGLIPMIHQAIPEVLPAPGIFALNIGIGAAAGFVLLHLAYGAIVGGMYAPVLHGVHRPATATH